MDQEKKRELLSPCGARCWECRAYPEECAGCRPIKGEVSWAPYVDAVICPIYACAAYTKSMANCGLCPELPCSLHTDMRDPDLPLEEHLEGVRERMRTLRQFNAAD